MYEYSVKIANHIGVHARPAAKIVKIANKYLSDVTLIKGEAEANAKSIMGIMMLAIGPESEMIIRASGPDEREVVESIVRLVESNFNDEP